MLAIKAPCPAGLAQEEINHLPGARRVSCGGCEWLTGEIFGLVSIERRQVQANIVSRLPSQFALYGIAPVTGSLVGLPEQGESSPPLAVINEGMAQKFGFASPMAAIGYEVPVPEYQGSIDRRLRIVAVVSDFSMMSIEAPFQLIIYLDQPFWQPESSLVSVN